MIRDAAVPVLLVTHDFGEAALLGDRVAVMDHGRVLQEGTASALAAAPASAFVADFTGAVVLTGEGRRERTGTTLVALDGGGEVVALSRRGRARRGQHLPVGDRARAAGDVPHDSARNHLDVRDPLGHASARACASGSRRRSR